MTMENGRFLLILSFLFFYFSGNHASAQSIDNKQLVLELNRELGGDEWRIQGRNLIVDKGSYSAGRGLWGIGTVTYELKYEYSSFVGINMWVLYVHCVSQANCIEDQLISEGDGVPNLSFVLSGDEARAKRALALLLKIK
jgi:hypothetical protein